MKSFSRKLSISEQDRLVQHLSHSNYAPHAVQHAKAAGKREGLTLVLYNSGALVVQGKKTAEWVEFVLEPEILQGSVAASMEGDASPESGKPRIGIDESGKGDFFGPMVIAGFHMTPELEPLAGELGVRDSKQISSDDKMIRVAAILREKAPTHVEVLRLRPETYNNLVERMGSVNRVLAWGHATVLENLLARHPGVNLAVADQFGPEHQIRSALKTRGKSIELVQRHKAESDSAVAAASILARADFVLALRELGESAGRPLPKGATHVRGVAEAMVQEQGPEALRKVAKTHFRTTRQVLEACGHDPGLLGTPQPKDWSGFKRGKSRG